MDRNRLMVSLAAVMGFGLLTAASLQAHHAFSAEFDASRPVKVQGTIVMVEWTNPHSWFHVDVKGADGKVERWMFEGGSPNSLTRRGFTKTYLKIGTEVIVEGYLAKGVVRR